MNLYIADLHFGHANCINFDHRPFSDVTEMDNVLIQLWNGRVYDDDDVYIIGDFCFKNAQDPVWYLKQLKGHKHLIKGNHDWKMLKNEEAVAYFESIDDLLMVEDSGEKIVLCHYPLAEWNNMFHGSWHIYGHIHANEGETADFMRTRERALNAGCMLNNYTPVSFRELRENNERMRRQKDGSSG